MGLEALVAPHHQHVPADHVGARAALPHEFAAVQLAALKFHAGLAEYAADLAVVDEQVVDPLDLDVHVRQRLDGPGHGHSGHAGDHHGPLGQQLRPQHIGDVHPGVLRREEGPAHAALAAGLGLRDHQVAVGRAGGGDGLCAGVGGIQRVVDLHPRAEGLRPQPAADLRLANPVGGGQQPVAPVGDGLDLIALAAQLLDGLPDGIAADAQSARQALAGDGLLLGHQGLQNIIPG